LYKFQKKEKQINISLQENKYKDNNNNMEKTLDLSVHINNDKNEELQRIQTTITDSYKKYWKINNNKTVSLIDIMVNTFGIEKLQSKLNDISEYLNSNFTICYNENSFRSNFKVQTKQTNGMGKQNTAQYLIDNFGVFITMDYYCGEVNENFEVLSFDTETRMPFILTKSVDPKIVILKVKKEYVVRIILKVSHKIKVEIPMSIKLFKKFYRLQVTRLTGRINIELDKTFTENTMFEMQLLIGNKSLCIPCFVYIID